MSKNQSIREINLTYEMDSFLGTRAPDFRDLQGSVLFGRIWRESYLYLFSVTENVEITKEIEEFDR